MSGSYKNKKVEEYRGFDIMYCVNGGRMSGERTNHYVVAKELEQISILALSSPKAAQNVIDTFINSQLKKTA